MLPDGAEVGSHRFFSHVGVVETADVFLSLPGEAVTRLGVVEQFFGGVDPVLHIVGFHGGGPTPKLSITGIPNPSYREV